MLGHVVARYLRERGCIVTTVSCKFSENNPAFLREIETAAPEWCINCTGLRAGATVPKDRLFEVNALLPQFCAQALRGRTRFFQASTDGVFRPDSKDRTAGEKADATDDYGVSKRIAEEAVIGNGGIVVRCSIIGPELGEPRSLLGWFLNQAGEVNGYTNHLWNGITTLEWAKVCWELIRGNNGVEGMVTQPGTWPPISKYELLRLIEKVWGLKEKVHAVQSPETISRTLIPTSQRPALEQQLQELRTWYSSTAPLGKAGELP